MTDHPVRCTNPQHGRGRHWHLTFLNRDGATRYATTRDPERVVTPNGWTFLAWGWDT